MKLNKYLILVIILAIPVILLDVFYNDIVSHPFSEFKGPSYVPSNFTKDENYTSDNENMLDYKGEGSFFAIVVKDPNQDKIKDFINPFEEDPVDSVNETTKNVSIHGHTAVFKVHEISIFNTTLAKFHVMWFCEKTKLTYIVTGLVSSDKVDEMEKMATSVQYHGSPFHIYL